MSTKEIRFNRESGLDSAVALALIDLNARYEATITLSKDDRVVATRSVLGMMALEIKKNDWVSVEVLGDESVHVLQEIESIMGH